MIQKGLKKGILVTWTKSFANPDGVGEDAVKMLEDALARRGVQYDITSRINNRVVELNIDDEQLWLDGVVFVSMTCSCTCCRTPTWRWWRF